MTYAGCAHHSESENDYQEGVGYICEKCFRAERNGLRARVAELEGALEEAIRVLECHDRSDSGDSNWDVLGVLEDARAALAKGEPQNYDAPPAPAAAPGMTTTEYTQLLNKVAQDLARPSAPAACTCGVIQGSRTSSQTHAPDCPQARR